MKVLAAVLLSGVVLQGAERIPGDYKLVYTQDFEKPESISDFRFTDPSAWTVSKDAKGGALELVKQSKYSPEVRSPVNIALLKDKLLGDFIVEADLIQTGREYGHRDMCLFFDVQSPKTFYYTHIATKADDHAHNIFIVNEKPRTKIAKKTTEGVNWGLEVWHKVRLERTSSDGSIKVYFDDMNQPLMVAEDKTFPNGFVGFGSFDDTGKIDNIKIWAPGVTEKKTEFYSSAPAK